MSNLDSVEDVCNDERIEIIDEVDLDEDEMIDVGMSIQMLVLNHAKKEMERGNILVLLSYCVMLSMHCI